MIAEGNYQFNGNSTNEPKIRGYSTPSSDFDWIKDIFKNEKNYGDWNYAERKATYENPFRHGNPEPKEPTKSKQTTCTKCQYEFTVSIDINPTTFICTICRGNMK